MTGTTDADVADSVFDRDGVDDLYELPPNRFVAARNDVAKRLREAGDREAARTVKRLRRPTVAAWAVNQAARAHPDQVDELLRLSDAVREQQAQTLEGREPGDMRTAMSKRRERLNELASQAIELAGDGHRGDVEATLDAASWDGEARGALRHGRLSTTLEPVSGFGLTGMPEVKSTPGRRRGDRRLVKRLERKLADAERTVATEEERLRRAEERLADAERGVDRARSKLDEARAERTAVAGELADARQS